MNATTLKEITAAADLIQAQSRLIAAAIGRTRAQNHDARRRPSAAIKYKLDYIENTALHLAAATMHLRQTAEELKEDPGR